MNPYTPLAVLLLLAGSYGSGRWQQYRTDETKAQAALLQATQKAREREEQWQIDAQAADEVHDEQMRKVSAARDAAIAGLRNRPERMPEAAASACAGGTGLQLSRRDAEFLAREASRADALRTEAQRLQAWIDSVTK